jgi:hypothetical protein
VRLGDALPGLQGPLAEFPLALDAATVAALTGLSRWKLYEAVRLGQLPAALMPIQVGRRFFWPTASVLEALGLLAGPGDGAAADRRLDSDGTPRTVCLGSAAVPICPDQSTGV